MFKNREFRVRVAKTDDANTTTQAETNSLTPEQIHILKEAATTVIVLVGGVWLTGKVIDAACNIIIKTL